MVVGARKLRDQVEGGEGSPKVVETTDVVATDKPGVQGCQIAQNGRITANTVPIIIRMMGGPLICICGLSVPCRRPPVRC